MGIVSLMGGLKMEEVLKIDGLKLEEVLYCRDHWKDKIAGSETNTRYIYRK